MFSASDASDDVPRSPGSLQRRLSRRLALQTFIGLALVFCFVFLAVVHRVGVRQETSLDEMQTLVMHLVEEAAAPVGLEDARRLLEDIFLGHEEYSLELSDATGTSLLLPDPSMVPPTSHGAHRPDGLGSSHDAWLGSGIHARDFTIDRAEWSEPLRARLVLDTYRDDDLLWRLALILATGLLTGTLINSLAASWRVSRDLRPLGRLAGRIDELDADTLEQRLDGDDQPAELRPIVERFNELLDRLARSYRQMASFNADVAHELNTPIATLVTSNEVALRRGVAADGLDDLLGSNLEELERLGGIVRDMLFLSTAERGARARTVRVASLAAEVRDVVEFHEGALEDAGLAVEVHGDTSADVDVRLLRRALSNLVGNATRHAERDSTIDVHVRRTGAGHDAKVDLIVSNIGDTVPPEHLGRLFERFYRVERTRAAPDADDPPRHGLGLAIVDAVARMHGGRAQAASADRLTSIGIVFPASRSG